MLRLLTFVADNEILNVVSLLISVAEPDISHAAVWITSDSFSKAQPMLDVE